MNYPAPNRRLPAGWRTARFDEFLKRVERKIVVDELTIYNRVGVRWYGQGAFVRDSVPGMKIARKQQWVINAGDVVYNKLFAWKGSFAVADDSVDGNIVSDKFPTYEANADMVYLPYLRYYFQSPALAEQAEALSKGAAAISKLTLNPPQFWDLTIPFPLVDEQRRIVAWIEALAVKIEEARALRQAAAEEVERLLASVEMQLWPDSSLSGAPSLKDVTAYLSRGKQSEQGASDHYLIKTRHVQMSGYVQTDMTLSYAAAEKVAPEAVAQYGDTLIACSAAGCLGRVAFYEDTNRVASTDTHVAIARPNIKVILPAYLYAYLQGAQGQFQLRSRERGDWTRPKISFRLTELNLSDLERVPVPLPPLAEQRRIVTHLDDLRTAADGLRYLQDETATELDALLPAILDKAFKGELLSEEPVTLADAFDLTKRQLILGALLVAAERIRAPRPVTVTHMMKLPYLLEREGGDGVRLPADWYQHAPYDFGAFDAAVYQDLDALEVAGLISQEYLSRKDGAIAGQRHIRVARGKAQALTEQIATLSEVTCAAVVRIAEAYAPLSANRLVRLLYEKYPETGTQSKLL